MFLKTKMSALSSVIYDLDCLSQKGMYDVSIILSDFWWPNQGLVWEDSSECMHGLWWWRVFQGCIKLLGFSSVQFSPSVVSDSLRPHELQHARPPCPSPTPGIHSNLHPSSPWCHPTILSSVVPFSSCPQSFPASGSFPMSQLFATGGQSSGVSASTSVLPMNTQDWSPLGWTGWISLQSKGLWSVFSNTTVQSINSLALSFLHNPTLTSIHDHWKK